MGLKAATSSDRETHERRWMEKRWWWWPLFLIPTLCGPDHARDGLRWWLKKRCWWWPLFLISTLCVVVLQVGPGPLLNTLSASQRAPSPSTATTTKDSEKPEAGEKPKERKGCDVLVAITPSASYRPLEEQLLLQHQDTAIQEIRERISQEHVYFALKFSIVGAILVVLFRLTGRGDIDEFLQMRRAALFFSAALLACGIVDTRLRFNALIMETLGEWLRDQVEPCLTEAIGARGVSLGGFPFWEMHFVNAGRSLIMATLRYFSLSLTALLHAVFIYLFMIVPTRAHKPTLWVVFWTSLALTALLAPVGASYCSFVELTGMRQAVPALGPLGSAVAMKSFYWSVGLAILNVLTVAVIFVGQRWKMRTFLDSELARILDRFGRRMKHLRDKANGVRTQMETWRKSKDEVERRMGLSLESELKQCWDEKYQLEAVMRKLIRRWHRWRVKLRLPGKHRISTAQYIADNRDFWRADELTSAGIPELPKALEELSEKTINWTEHRPQEENRNQPKMVPGEDVPDLEEYLWNLCLLERDRRHAVPQRPVGYQTRRSWWAPDPPQVTALRGQQDNLTTPSSALAQDSGEPGDGA